MGILSRSSLACALLLAAGCNRHSHELRVESVANLAPAGALTPQVSATAKGSALLSWLEPRAEKGYRFRGALDGKTFTIDDSPEITMYGADLPGLMETADGALFAYWERKDARAANDPYATAIHLARSTDHGQTWSPLPSPHSEAATGEHSFLSAFPAGSNTGLVWLDAQKQTHLHGAREHDTYTGAIGLRFASYRADGSAEMNGFIDPITCECCPTSAAVSARGPVVAYRNRVDPEGTRPEDVHTDLATVRDIYVTRWEQNRWTEPRRVYADNWVINGCPDNGPAVDAREQRVAVAWWTGAGETPHVSVAFSNDNGDHFEPPIRVSAKAAEGQVTVALAAGGTTAIVGWLEDHQNWARRVELSGSVSAAVALGPAPHHARLPRWFGTDDGALATWTDFANETRNVRMARLHWR